MNSDKLEKICVAINIIMFVGIVVMSVVAGVYHLVR
jgi:hypothetical protein